MAIGDSLRSFVRNNARPVARNVFQNQFENRHTKDAHNAGWFGGGGDSSLVTVGESGAYSSIQDAHDSLGGSWVDSGTVFVLPDYDRTVEDGPVVWSKRASLWGGNYTIIGNGGTALVVDMGKGNRPPGPHFYNFTTDGAIRVDSGRYTVWRDIDVNNAAGSGGFEFSAVEDLAKNSHHLYSCTAENGDGYGFYVGSNVHAVNLWSCQGYFNDLDGLYVADNAFSTRVFGGSFEQNARNGIRLDGSNNTSLWGIYLEGNNANTGGGSDVLITGGAAQTSIASCYGNGTRDTERMIYVATSTHTDIRFCDYRWYTKSMIYVRPSASNVDVNRQTHITYDDTPFGTMDGEYVRSNGILVPQDLTQTDGQFEGDMGIHIRDGGKPAFCTWRNGDWYTHGVSRAL